MTVRSNGYGDSGNPIVTPPCGEACLLCTRATLLLVDAAGTGCGSTPSATGTAERMRDGAGSRGRYGGSLGVTTKFRDGPAIYQ
jgi:hypothetical protein